MNTARSNHHHLTVAVVGPITADLSLVIADLPEPGGSVVCRRVRSIAGGKGTNPALAVIALGAKASLVGAVGTDDAGQQVVDQIAAAGVNVDGIQRVAGPTGRIVHLVEPGGGRRFIDVPAANDLISLDANEITARLAGADLLLVSTSLPAEPVQAAVRAGRQAGVFVVVDASGDPAVAAAALECADAVRVDTTEAQALTGALVHDFDSASRAARALQHRGPQLVAVQAGTHGNLVRSADEEIRIPLLDLPLTDPTGAGDAFIATLVVTLARGEDLHTAAHLASAAAAHTAAQLGGTPRFDETMLHSLTRDHGTTHTPTEQPASRA